MEEKREWMGMYPEELKQALTAMGEKPFRAGQLFTWLHKGAKFEDMTNLPLSLREKLAEKGVDQPVTVRETRVSGLDGTKKFLFALPDGNGCLAGYFSPEDFMPEISDRRFATL